MGKPMPRKAGINYWKSRQGYGCWIDGRQRILAKGPKDGPLGPTYKAAEKLFEELTALQRVNRAGEANTIRVICEEYCRYLAEHRSANTLRIRHKALLPFVAEFGGRHLSSLVRHEVSQWLDRMRKEGRVDSSGQRRFWKAGQRRTVVTSLNAAFNWAIEEGIITRNPVAGLEQGEPESRAQKAYIDAPLFQKIVSRVRGNTREYIRVLRLTGARPGEIANARGEDFDPIRKAIVYPWRGNSAGFKPKTHASKKDRVIYLAGEALRIILARIERYGGGYLFPSPSKAGGISNRPRSMKAVYNIFQKLGNRLGVQRLSPYCLRHSFITDWLAERDDIETLSELVGSSPN